MTSPASPTVAQRIPKWVWVLPWALFAVSAPLWLHTYEPAQFLALNALFATTPAVFWAGLSLLGNGWGVLGVTAPLLVLAPRLMWAWLCAAPFAIGFARFGKWLIVSPRPAAVVDNDQMRVVGELLHNVSMPSGHTLTAFAVASGIYFALPAQRRWRHGWLFVLALAAGLSRIAVGAHWPGDVAVGACLGMLAGMLGQGLLARIGPQHCQSGAWSLRLVAALLLAAAYNLALEGLDFDEAFPVQRGLVVVIALSLVVFVWRNVAVRVGSRP
jgi:membrane-associated phospholipid phosphatase